MTKNRKNQTLENKLGSKIIGTALITALAAPTISYAKNLIEIPTHIAAYRLEFLEKEISKNDNIFEINEHRPNESIAKLKEKKTKIKVVSDIKPEINGTYPQDKLRVLCVDRDEDDERGIQYGPYKLNKALPRTLTNGSYDCYLTILEEGVAYVVSRSLYHAGIPVIATITKKLKPQKKRTAAADKIEEVAVTPPVQTTPDVIKASIDTLQEEPPSAALELPPSPIQEEDICKLSNLYNDGKYCDTFCLKHDPDCDIQVSAPASRTLDVQASTPVLRTTDAVLAVAPAQTTTPNETLDIEDYCESSGYYNDGRCDNWCPNPDPDCDVQVSAPISTTPEPELAVTPPALTTTEPIQVSAPVIVTPDAELAVTPPGSTTTDVVKASTSALPEAPPTEVAPPRPLAEAVEEAMQEPAPEPELDQPQQEEEQSAPIVTNQKEQEERAIDAIVGLGVYAQPQGFTDTYLANNVLNRRNKSKWGAIGSIELKLLDLLRLGAYGIFNDLEIVQYGETNTSVGKGKNRSNFAYGGNLGLNLGDLDLELLVGFNKDEKDAVINSVNLERISNITDMQLLAQVYNLGNLGNSGLGLSLDSLLELTSVDERAYITDGFNFENSLGLEAAGYVNPEATLRNSSLSASLGFRLDAKRNLYLKDGKPKELPDGRFDSTDLTKAHYIGPQLTGKGEVELTDGWKAGVYVALPFFDTGTLHRYALSLWTSIRSSGLIPFLKDFTLSYQVESNNLENDRVEDTTMSHMVYAGFGKPGQLNRILER